MASFASDTTMRSQQIDKLHFHHLLREGWLRFMENTVWGVTVHLSLTVAYQMAMPVLQTVLNWLVTLEWYRSGDLGWATSSATIYLFSGTLMGLIFARDLTHAHFGVRARYHFAYPVGLLVGVPGLAKAAATFAVGMYAPDVERVMRTQMPVFEIMELLTGALPAMVLKASIGFTYGWSSLILSSLFVSLLGAGITVFRWEGLARNDVTGLGLWTRYGVIMVVLRATQASLLLMCLTILGCANKSFGIFAVVIGLCSFCGIVFEPTFREDGQWTKAPVICFVCFMATIGTIIAAFLRIEPANNNYQNISLPPAPPGYPQHLDCTDIQYEILVAALAFCCILAPLSWVMDPMTGVRGCRAASWQERLDSDSNGVSEDQVADLKVHAVWAWANVYESKSDLLEPWEIYRLAQIATVCGLGGRMRRTTSLRRQRHNTMVLKAQRRSGRRRWAHSATADAEHSSDNDSCMSDDDSCLSYSDSELSASSEEDVEAQLAEDEATRHWHYQGLCR